jgi:hypothetical protein
VGSTDVVCWGVSVAFGEGGRKRVGGIWVQSQLGMMVSAAFSNASSSSAGRKWRVPPGGLLLWRCRYVPMDQYCAVLSPCLLQFTSKMEGMVTDLALAREKQQNFEEWKSQNERQLPIDISVTVLTTGGLRGGEVPQVGRGDGGGGGGGKTFFVNAGGGGGVASQSGFFLALTERQLPSGVTLLTAVVLPQ